MPPGQVVIVGAGLAGLRTAERLRRLGYGDALTLIGAEEHPPYDRPPLSKSLLAAAEAPEPPSLRPADRYAELDLDLRLGVRATALDTETRTVSVSGSGGEDALHYDHVVIATGLAPRMITDWGNVHALRTFEDCVAIRRAAANARHATVVGAGVLGSEVAATLRQRGLEVDVVDPLPQPLCRVVGEHVGAMVADLHRQNGVGLHLGRGVARIDTERATHRVALDDDSAWETDLVAVAIGGVAHTEWLNTSGLALDDGVVVDETGAASAPGVWAAGDVARKPDPRGGGHVRLEHWTSAGDTAASVGVNIHATLNGDPTQALQEVPYVWSDQYDLKLQCLGLPRESDDVVVIAGSLESRRFLAAYLENGRVRAVAGAGMAAAVARCRQAVAEGAGLDDLVAAAPWDRKLVRT